MVTQDVIMVHLVQEKCITCGVIWGVPSDYQSRRKQDHNNFYCPNGHTQCYIGKSDAERLREELDRVKAGNASLHDVLTRKNEQLQEKDYRIRSLKGAKTRIENRVKNGVCPCCNRTFKNLAAHFKTQHPDML